jgi:hypothetical protein
MITWWRPALLHGLLIKGALVKECAEARCNPAWDGPRGLAGRTVRITVP